MVTSSNVESSYVSVDPNSMNYSQTSDYNAPKIQQSKFEFPYL